jgi:hypothetical protein
MFAKCFFLHQNLPNANCEYVLCVLCVCRALSVRCDVMLVLTVDGYYQGCVGCVGCGGCLGGVGVPTVLQHYCTTVLMY